MATQCWVAPTSIPAACNCSRATAMSGALWECYAFVADESDDVLYAAAS
jgi:hypothetical protein